MGSIGLGTAEQHHWVALLRAGNETSVEVLERLRAAVDTGDVVVPLVCGHYLETWNRAKTRTPLVYLDPLMRDISRWRTLLPTQEVARREIERALGGRAPLTSSDVLGRGVNHAFASATGRFRLGAGVDSRAPGGGTGDPRCS